MLARIGFLCRPERIERLLKSDGWRLEPTTRGSQCLARHPDLKDEPSARERLYRLGLLTSTSVRIEFVRAKDAAASS